MGRYYCSMTNCHNYTGKIGKFNKTVTLHKLPKNHVIRRAWIRAISRKYWKPSDYTRVCSDHFKDGIGPNSLYREMIPTENLAQFKPKREPISRSSRLSTGANDSVLINEEHCELESPDANLIEQIHSYAQGKNNMTCEEDVITVSPTQLHCQTCCDIGVQSIPATADANINTSCRPEITIEDIKDSEAKIQFYTGFPNFVTFDALFSTLMDFDENTLDCDIGRKRKLRPVDEFLLVMMRLRLGLLVKDLEYRFKVSSGTVSKIFKTWIVYMYTYLQSIVVLRKLKILQKRIPACFKSFSDTRIVLDCTEIFVQTPSSLDNKSLTYSNYKSHNTFKALVGVSMTGAVVFIPKLWGGSTSDVEITRESGLLDLLDSGDALMVDKGFIHLKTDLAKLGVKLYCPPFKTKEQFSKEEVDFTRRIASARIHVERKMEQIKNFRILQGTMPLAINKLIDEIFFVCGALTNLLPPLVS